jgi:uncharacterized membrane protein
MNKNHLWLILFILIAFALRLVLLARQSLWYDEGVTWMLSQMKLGDLINWTAADIQPPLYYLLIWATDIIFDDSEWALRFPSVLFNILTLPLVYVLTRRLTPLSSRHLAPAPLLAVALFSFSPLMVYYSQEARMYTLLAFESTLASFLLLRMLQAHSPGQPQLHPSHSLRPRLYTLLYILTATAALYTHYFALFLWAAHVFYTLFSLWWQRFPKPLLIQSLWGYAGALILFLAWLPILVARLGDDPSYWPGALKLNEALRKVAITFTSGETVFERIGWPLALGYLAILLICVIWAFTIHRLTNQPNTAEKNRAYLACAHSYSSFLLPLLWLLLPITLILTLSYQSPKFNPRYTLLAWPAFAILLAIILTNFRLPPASSHSALRFTLYVLRFTFYAFIFGTMLYSLFNWFTDPRFSKDDFRALAQFVRERKADDETVLLSSGHMFPVWAYYYGWEGWTPLPWMLRLDVNRVTNLSIAANIAEAVEGQGGVWLVTWQDEVIDPNGVAPFWLDRIGNRPIDAGDFWGVGLEHWRLDPDKIELLQKEPIAWPTQVNFADQVDLVGYTQLTHNELALFWRPRRPLPDDLVLTLDITDPDGFSWDRETAVGRPGAYLYPPSRWPTGQVVVTRHRLDWQIGSPPGLYIVEVGLGRSHVSATADVAQAAASFTNWDILDEQGRPQRRTALLDYINLSHVVLPPGGPLPMAKAPIVDFFPIIGLRRAILPQEQAQPGDRVLLALLWQAGQFNLDDVSIAFDLIDTQGERFRVGSSLTPSRHFNLPRWNPRDVVLGQYWLNIPPDAAAGPAKLELHIVNETGFHYRKIFPFAEIEILPTERNFTPPETMDMAVGADFSGQVTLLGADCPAGCRIKPGQSVSLTLYWQVEAPFEIGYTIFTHLLGPAETVPVNADHAPPKPTTGWVPGEIITDPVNLTIPPDQPPGLYPIEVGLYNAADPAYPRLPLANGETRVLLPQPLSIQ